MIVVELVINSFKGYENNMITNSIHKKIAEISSTLDINTGSTIPYNDKNIKLKRIMISKNKILNLLLIMM